MKYPLLFISILTAPIPALAGVQTLEQVLALAYEHDPGLQAERAKLRATDEQLSQALSNYRPTIDVTGEAGKSQENIANGLFADTGTLTPRDANINITQPVFRGFRTRGSVDSAEATIRATQAELQQTEQQLLLDTAKAYLDVLQGQQIVEISRRHEADLTRVRDITRDRFGIGELKKTDVDQAESRLKVAEVGRMQAESDLANKRDTFTRLTGVVPETLQPPNLPVDQVASRAEAITTAMTNSPEILAATYNQQAADADVTTARGNLLPEVNIVGSAGSGKDENVTIPQRQDSYSLMAKVTIPLYRAGTDYSKTRAAQETLSQREDELENTRNKVREAASSAWQTLTTSKEAIIVDQEAVGVTENALDGVQEEAKVGTCTTIDVLNAEQELLDAKVNLVKAEHDEAVAALQLREVIGQLTAAALHLPVTLYDPLAHYEKARRQWIGF